MRRFLIFALLLGVLLTAVFCAQAESILPPLATPKPDIVIAPSLHSVTALDPSGLTATEDNGLMIRYDNVTNECYEAFGVALGQAGYALTGNNTDENGTLTLSVSNGGVTLTLAYQPEQRVMTVTYPPQVEPRETEQYGSYTELRDGDAFPVGEGVTARVEGWQTADAWNELYYSSRYLISGRTSKHEADAEKREVLVKLTLTNDSILPVEVRAQLVGISATWANKDTEHPYFGSLGEYSGLPAINVRPGDGGGVMLQPKSEGAAAIGVECMAARHTAEDTLALTFTTPARDKRYVYFIKPFETP